MVYFFGSAFTLPLRGTHTSYTTGIDQNSGSPGLISGKLQGGLRNVDLQMTLIPKIADALTQVVVNHGMQAQQILAMDVGGCMNFNGNMAKAGDKVIDACEVLQNMVFAPVLATDVQLFDNMGVFKPNPMNGAKDSWSMAIAFTAVQANF